MDYIRDYAMYASVFGMFSFAWFGWTQERPRQSWRLYLGIASGAALVVCLLGVYLSITNWNEASALNEVDSFRTYLITFYAEFIVAGVAAFILIRKKLGDFVAPMVALIVGLHFIALAPAFDDNGLYVLAGLLTAVAIVSTIVAPKLGVARSAIAGIGSGTVLFVFAVLGLIRYFTA